MVEFQTLLFSLIVGSVVIIIVKLFFVPSTKKQTIKDISSTSSSTTSSTTSSSKLPSVISNNSNNVKVVSNNDGCCKDSNGNSSCDCANESDSNNDSCCSSTSSNTINSIRILYGTQTGTTKELSNDLKTRLDKELNPKYNNSIKIEVEDLSTYDLDELSDEDIVIFIVSTYTHGKPPDTCIAFFDWLDAHSLDWRVDKGSYSHLKYSVFGVGNSVYKSSFNTASIQLDKILYRLTSNTLLPVGLGDNGAGEDLSNTFIPWTNNLVESLLSLSNNSGTINNNNNSNVKVVRTSEENDEDPEDNQAQEPLVDLEDLGRIIKPNANNNNNNSRRSTKVVPKAKSKAKSKAKEEVISDEDSEDSEDDEEDDNNNNGTTSNGATKEMLTPSLRKSLTKQGYRLLGSHSGVKMCRWTKAMLRGRGGCYKHTFYGITSYQCMEMTPSLACANKCVFCWRHHKNPVGTEWKWKVDPPEFLLEEAIKNHQSLIKQMKGVPGVVKERYEDAFTVKHCALSLVGEPITYPHINRFVDLLHEKDISSFMVTNAQFPDKIDELKTVTQLYISVDAATKESLQKIDRPIFPDFWERFLACMDSLAKKKQRTVYRLTLVKDWNMEEVKNYVELINRGKPSFVEVKGVTYCGTSKASTLTMQNVPFHQEVINFATALCNTPEMGDYELAVEHEHSCAVLICHKRFKSIDENGNTTWNTWINYPKFQQLVKSGVEFDDTEYMAPSPAWTLIGCKEKGFDPEEVRFKRNKPYQNAGC